MRTTTTGTTIAGTRVLRFEEEDEEAAAVEVGDDVDLDADCDEARVDVDLTAAAEVSEAYSRASVMVLVRSVVMVVGVGTVWASVNVSTTVVSPETAFAVAMGAVVASVTIPLGPIDEGRFVFGFPILEGRSDRP